MKLKTIVAATLLGVSSFAAQAVPLSSLPGGDMEFKLSGVTTEFYTWAGTSETTWGVGNITQITTPSSQGAASIWNSGEGGDYLGYMIYGIDDLSNSGVSPNINLYNVGATGGVADGNIYIDVFKLAANPVITTPSARTGYNAYTGVTSASLWLRLVLVPGIVADDPSTAADESTLATLSQTVTGLTLPATGSGTFFANVVGGSAMSKFNTDGFTTLLGTDADMYGIFDLRDSTAGARPTCNVNDTDCFFGLIRDPIIATAIPEPGSMALAGLGLIGLAALRRRKESA